MKKEKKKEALGKGLGALFENTDIESFVNSKESIEWISIDDIKGNKEQPRKNFDKEALKELSCSISDIGVVQPILVKKVKNGYEIIAGERRWRASRMAGLKEIPCIIKDFSEEEKMLVAIIENIQREDLNPVEEAEGFLYMVDNFNLTNEEVAARVGKSRPYVSNALRMLSLPEKIKAELRSGNISAGHGRALILLSDKEQEILLKRIKSENLSVRDLEAIIKQEKVKKSLPKGRSAEKNPDILKIERDLSVSLGAKVSIEKGGNKGAIRLEFYTQEELERLLEILSKK